MRQIYRLIQKIKSKRLLLLLLLIVLVIVGIAAFQKFSDSPQQGTVQTTNENPAAIAPVDQPLTQKITGQYIAFTTPAGFKPVTAGPPAGSQLEVFAFANRSLAPPGNLNVQVLNLPSGNLNDDASYNMRANNPSQYEKLIWTINNQPVAVVKDQSAGFGEVAFLPKDNKVVEIAMTSSASTNSQKLEAALKNVLTSFEFL